MVDTKKFIWIFPVVGAIFGIVTLLLPVMTLSLTNISYSVEWTYWIFGVTVYRYTSNDPFVDSVWEVAFTDNPTLFTVSIISTAMIIVAVVLLFIGGISKIRNIRYSKKFMAMTGFGIILLFVGEIIFWAEAAWPTTPHSISALSGNVWNLFNEGFSIYAPLIGGGIAIPGIPLHYYFLKKKIEKSAKAGEFGLKTKRSIEKVAMKKYIWVFPIIGVIFGIITFLAPTITFNITAYQTLSWQYWIWGLTSYSLTYPGPFDPPGISEIAFTNNTQLLTFSIISSIMIFVAVIALLIAGRTSRKKYAL